MLANGGRGGGSGGGGSAIPSRTDVRVSVATTGRDRSEKTLSKVGDR